MVEIGREALIELLRERAETGDKVLVVGISGYGGSGKTTLAAELGEKISGSTVIGVDEYYVIEDNLRDYDWSVFKRDKFRDEITLRVESGEFKVVICEGCGIFHPDTVDQFSIRVWVDTDLETATLRGMKRERSDNGLNLDDVWREIWEPNERSFEAKHDPKGKAHYSVKNDGKYE
jgi:uridine kinase